MGGILAVSGAGEAGWGQRLLLEMSQLAPYRGRLETHSAGPVVLGVQTHARDASAAELDDLVVLVHGYVVSSSFSCGNADSAAHAVAARWREHGASTLKELDGEFSVLVFQRGPRLLHAACSVGGTRPLFFGTNGDVLCCGSEVRQVRRGLGVDPSLDEPSFVRMLLQRPLPMEGTLDSRVSRIYPSILYRFEASEPSRGPHRSPFWEPPLPGRGGETWSFRESAERTRRVVTRAVEDATPNRLWALSLSGGRDSGAIWALAVRSAAEQSQAFLGRACSLVFPDMKCDERSLIEDAIQHSGGPEPIWIEAASIDPIERGLALLPDLDVYPYLTTYFIDLVATAAAADGRPVVLTGNGGDEWLGGDPIPYLRQEFSSGHWIRGLRGLAGYELPPWVDRRRYIWSHGLRPAVGRTLRTLGLRRAQPPRWLSAPAWEEIREDPEIGWLDGQSGPVRSHLAESLHRRRTAFEFWSMEQVVSRRECEVRLPFMHRRVIDLAFRTPPEHVIGCRREKHLMREALSDLYPATVAGRVERTHFSDPFESRRESIVERLSSHRWAMQAIDSIDGDGLSGVVQESASATRLWSVLGLYMADRFVATSGLLEKADKNGVGDRRNDHDPRKLR